MSDIAQPLAGLIKSGLEPKDFRTGSKGFFASGKITTTDGTRYQAQAQAVLIGSKGNPEAEVEASTDEVQAAIASMIAKDLPEREFSTGRTGYRVQDKIEAHGQRFQASVQAVRLS